MRLTEGGKQVADMIGKGESLTLWERFAWEAMKTIVGAVTHHDAATNRPMIFHPPDAIVNAAWIADEMCNLIARRQTDRDNESARIDALPPGRVPSTQGENKP